MTGLGNPHADFCLIVADLSGVQLEEVVTTLQDFRANNPQAKALNATLPALEVEENGQTQLLTSSLAIAQYIAEVGGKPELLGKTPFERAQVD